MCIRDRTTTGYMKIQTADIMKKFLPFVNHAAIVIEVSKWDYIRTGLL